MTIFGPKPWVNPFGKMSIFRLFHLLVFIVQKGVFSFQNIVKDIFLAYIALKKKWEKWPFLDKNHGLTPLEKCQFFDFLNFLFLQPRKAFFRSRISQKTFSLAILPKKKLNKWPLLNKNHGLTRLEKLSIFLLFELLVYIAQEGVFSFQNIVKDILLAYIAKKKKFGKWASFDQNHWLTPCKNVNYSTF